MARTKLVAPFKTIVADPPWSFGDRLPGPTRGAEKNYRVMSFDDICGYKLPPIADDAVLFLWRVEAGTDKGPSLAEQAYLVARAWGFKPKSAMVWVKLTKGSQGRSDGTLPPDSEIESMEKLHFGMGRSVRNCHESCIIATRGRPERLSGSVRSVFFAPVQEHSQKPEVFYDLVEKMYSGPHLELFARRQREDWTCLGDEVLSR